MRRLRNVLLGLAGVAAVVVAVALTADGKPEPLDCSTFRWRPADWRERHRDGAASQRLTQDAAACRYFVGRSRRFVRARLGPRDPGEGNVVEWVYLTGASCGSESDADLFVVSFGPGGRVREASACPR